MIRMEKKGAAAGARDVNLLVWESFSSYSGCNLRGKQSEGHIHMAALQSLCNFL